MVNVICRLLDCKHNTQEGHGECGLERIAIRNDNSCVVYEKKHKHRKVRSVLHEPNDWELNLRKELVRAKTEEEREKIAQKYREQRDSFLRY